MAKTAVLKIYGDIGESDPMMEAYFGVTDGNIGAKTVSDFLEANPDATDIVVRINSRGGDVQEGWAIYDLLTTSGKHVRTVGEGKVYSIATIIFLAGTEREMYKNADGLIHNPYIPPYSLDDKYESADLVKIAESLAQEEAKILDFYAERTGSDKAKLAEYMKDETKLSAEDMVTLGFATKIVEPVKAYAYIKPNKNIFTMTPQEEATFFEKVTATMARAIEALGLSRLPASTAQELTDKDGNKLTLTKEAGAPAVGDEASPDGTFTMENGDVIVVTAGKIESITPAAPEETELDKANKEVARLTAALADAEAAKTAAEAAAATAAIAATAATAAKADFTARTAEAAALVTELTNLKNNWKPEARMGQTGSVKKGVINGIDLDRVAEIQELTRKK